MKTKPTLRLEYRKASELEANPRNWRKHPKAQRKALEAVISEVGWAGALLYNERTGRLIDGHLRKEVSGNGDLIPVLVGSWTDEQERVILATLDPIAAMAETDKDELAGLLEAVESQDEGIQALLDEVAQENRIQRPVGDQVDDPGAQVDKADELQAKWKVERGQIWQVGKHRVMCGDARCDIRHLIKDAVLRFEFSDPPYQLGCVRGGGVMKDAKYLTEIERAGINTFTPRGLELVAKTAVYCCNKVLIPDYLALAEVQRVAWDICFYTKTMSAPNYGGHLMSDTEYLMLLGAQPPIPGQEWGLYSKAFTGKRDEGALMGWQKPVELIAKFLRLYTVGKECVVDRFCGSGTTIVACEQLNRVGYGMEIEPKYVAVTLERLSGMGLKPKVVA